MKCIIDNDLKLFYDQMTGTYFRCTIGSIRRNLNSINRTLMEDYDPKGPKYGPEDILKWISSGVGLGTKTSFFCRVPKCYIPWYWVDCEMTVCVTESDEPCTVVKWILYYN